MRLCRVLHTQSNLLVRIIVVDKQIGGDVESHLTCESSEHPRLEYYHFGYIPNGPVISIIELGVSDFLLRVSILGKSDNLKVTSGGIDTAERPIRDCDFRVEEKHLCCDSPIFGARNSGTSARRDACRSNGSKRHLAVSHAIFTLTHLMSVSERQCDGMNGPFTCCGAYKITMPRHHVTKVYPHPRPLRSSPSSTTVNNISLQTSPSTKRFAHQLDYNAI